MKVYLGTPATTTAGGMYRVYALLHEFLPLYGVSIVDSLREADVVHTHIAVYEAIPVDKPLVVSSHGLLWEEHAWGKSGWHINQKNFQAYLLADVVTAPSNFVAKAISRHTLIPTKVVHHGIDATKWLPATESRGYVLWNKARVDAANNPQDMNLLANLAPTVPFISTFGQETSNVRVVGQLAPGEIKELVANAAVYLDTPKESGGPCFGVLEAMSCGVPILAWDEGGNAEAIVHKETGFLARVGDYENLLEGLHYCLANRERLGNNARQTVIEKYSAEQSVRGYVEAYTEAINSHRHPVKVSIVVPCYNLGHILPQCVYSIQRQDFTNWEMLIIDDKSTDDSVEIAQKIAATDSRIKVIANEENRHTADSRNTGAWLAQGEYIMPLDADDRLAPDALGRMVALLDTKREIQVVSGALVLFHESDLEHGRLSSWPNDAEYERQIAGYNRIPYCALYRRKVWENTGGYRRRIRSGVEDADFWTRAFSFGYRAELLPGEPVLLYTVRDTGLHKKNPLGEKAWLPWFPWSYVPELTPGAALGDGPYKIWSEDPPLISVIIPVGPQHAHHLQACVDSIVAQDFPHWEIVIINDTGQRWFDSHGTALTPFVLGLSFATIIDSDGQNHGVAWARNRGIERARGKFLVFLDVDDIAQPSMLSTYLYAHEQADGGWIYSDWFAIRGNKAELSTAKDWDSSAIINKSLAPLTGLYEREHVLSVGGFAEDAPGWEDWDFQLKLLEEGICGTRVATPLLSYNMHLGQRREDNFAARDNLLKYITSKHEKLYAQNKRGTTMACSKCGGKKTITGNTRSATNKATEDVDDIVKIVYTGAATGSRHYRSPNFKNVMYKVNGTKPFSVFKQDVAFFLQFRDFKVYETPKPTPVSVPETHTTPTLFSETQLTPPNMPERNVKFGDLDELDLKLEVINILRARFNSIQDIDMADDSQILELRGMGPGRLATLRTAIEQWKQ